MMPKYEGVERRTNEQSFRIPAITLIIAIVIGLLALAGWSLDLERRKVDKADFVSLVDDVKDIQKDVKKLIGLVGRR